MSMPAALENGLVSHKRTAVKVSGLALLALSFQTLGIIYSDIGTSPLYTLNGIWPSTGPVPSEEDVIGGISAIFWSLTLLPLIKYVFISLWFGTNEGEGGTFALYQGLFPPGDMDMDADRTLTGDSFTQVNSFESNKPQLSNKLKWPLLVWCLFGTSLTMADGVFTPAVSVTSAVAGIGVAKPSVDSDIVGISIAILVVMFLGQRFGTAKIAFLFAPVALIWFLVLAGTGIYNITFHPGIFRAFDPSRAILLFVRTKDYDILSGVILALTGCEAVFANLGQFNALSIRISFSTFVYPALVLAYFGQGARLIHDGEAVLTNVFYQTIPGPTNGGFYWFVFVVAVLATIIASQAMITATFSLIQQIINMKSLPPLRMIYTSETIQGQVYIPAVNWILMIITIIVVGAFKSSTNLSNAYGFAVATVMISTSVLISLQMRYRKRLALIFAVGFFTIFVFLDALFWGAALKKVPQGAWVPLMIGCILMILMFFWTWAKRLEDKFDGANRQNLRHFITPGEKDGIMLNMQAHEGVTDTISEEEHERSSVKDSHYYYVSGPTALSRESTLEKGQVKQEKRELVRIPTCAVFHKLARGRGVPHTFVGFIRQWPALPRVVIFLSVSVLPVPRIAAEDRYVVNKVRSVEGFYGVTYYLGFRDDFDVKIEELVNQICAIETRADPRESSATISEIRRVTANATHIVPHYHIVSKQVDAGRLSFIANWTRKFLIEDLYYRFVTMFPETANWLTSADEIIHVGINATI